MYKFLLTLSCAAAVFDAAAQEAIQPAVTGMQVQARSDVADLVCEKKPLAARPARAPDPDPMEIPDDSLVPVAPPPAASAAAPSRTLPAPAAALERPYRMAIWGDSHLAAGFFTEELAKQLNLPPDGVSNVLLPANMGRAGVRLPLRRACVSSDWKYEPGYLGRDNATAPGPGLMNMFSDAAGATLAWDVRKNAQAPGHERIRVLYQQTAAPLRIGVSVDGGAEQEVTLQGAAGPGILELDGDRPLSQVKLRLIDGAFRFQGLELFSARAHPFEMDVFGYPGATAAGWRSADLGYLRSWFQERSYDLVALEFGTNEGNVKPFDIATYRANLVEAVRNMRAVFPMAACVLIAPGDRGVLVPRSANLRKKGRTAARTKQKKAPARPGVDLLAYSKIHADIARVQKEVAEDAGCLAWSMQEAMGGPGASYRWAQQSPALMAKDLIHFTAAGYRQLARDFVRDIGWTGLPAQARPGEAAPVTTLF